MKYPQELLRDIYWSFENGHFDNQTDFENALKEYYKEISGSRFPLKMDDKVLEVPEIIVQYMKYNYDEDEWEEPQEEFHADNNDYFTVGELLYKIHNAIGKKLEDDDNVYFEGLTFGAEDSPNLPLYFLDTGN